VRSEESAGVGEEDAAGVALTAWHSPAARDVSVVLAALFERVACGATQRQLLAGGLGLGNPPYGIEPVRWITPASAHEGEKK
jgi:hypothetical protein